MEKTTRDVSGHTHGPDGRFVTVGATVPGRQGGTVTSVMTPHELTIGRVESKDEKHTGFTHEGAALAPRTSRDQAQRDVERSYLHHARRVAARPKALHENVMRSYLIGYDPKREHGNTFPVKRWNMSAKRLDSMARASYRLGLHFGSPAAESRINARASERVEHPQIDAIVARHIPGYAHQRHHEVMPEQARAIIQAAWNHGVGQHKQEVPKKAASLFGGSMTKDTAPVPGNELVAQSLERKGRVVRRGAAGRRRRSVTRLETKMNKRSVESGGYIRDESGQFSSGCEHCGGGEHDGHTKAHRDQMERMWISGRASGLTRQGMHPVEASKQATYESQQHLKAEAAERKVSKSAISKRALRRVDKNFKTVQRGIERKEGYSPGRAAAIAAAAGRKKLGQKEMTRRSVAGRKRKKSDAGHAYAMLKRAGAQIPACECGWEGHATRTKMYSKLLHRRHVSGLTKSENYDKPGMDSAARSQWSYGAARRAARSSYRTRGSTHQCTTCGSKGSRALVAHHKRLTGHA